MKLLESGRAYSFWRTKMIDTEMMASRRLMRMEDVHVKQLHTVDVLLVEIIKDIFGSTLSSIAITEV